MKRIFILTAALLALAITAQTANAEPTDPIVRGDLEVQIIGQGKVTGTGIDCPGDCAQRESWPDTEGGPVNTLTATANKTGWAFQSWSGGCTVQSNRALCKSSYGTEEAVVSVAKFIDVMAPTTYISYYSPSDEVNDSILVGVSATDNDSVTRVEYLIDGQVVATDTTAPYGAELDTRAYAEGPHQIQARAFDPAGNNGITSNLEVVIDHTAPEVTLNSPVAATRDAKPQFSFASPSSDFDGADCVIQRAGEDRVPEYCEPDQWFAGDAPTEGQWEFTVYASDRAGNVSKITHSFVVDRTAPEVNFTSGPADAAKIGKGNVTYGWSIDDSTAVGQDCSWDGGEATACDGTASKVLAKGDHTFRMVATDAAGNSSEVSRKVTVLADGDPDPNDPDPNDPDPNDPDADRTAPTVKLSSKKQKLKALEKGLKVKVRCSEACAGTVVAKAAGGIRFTGRARLAAEGSSIVRLKPNAKAKKALRNSPGSLRLKVVSKLADTAGNSTTSKLKTRIRK